jgi:tannase/feruloyl esterase
VRKGYVVGTSDHGHGAPGNGSFAMNPDGIINTVLWKDFAERSLHELADKTKALAKAYYGKPHKHAYWDAYSTGGWWRVTIELAHGAPPDDAAIRARRAAIYARRAASERSLMVRGVFAGVAAARE